jgi:CheY-like chemotaxis protein
METSNSGGKVLVVEDDPTVLDVVTTILQQHGYSVVRAHDGREAWTAFHFHAADLVLLIVDIALPKVDGPEFVDNLPTRVPRIPVIFTTGLGHHASRKVPGFPVLHKPFTHQTLFDAVERALQGSLPSGTLS